MLYIEILATVLDLRLVTLFSLCQANSSMVHSIVTIIDAMHQLTEYLPLPAGNVSRCFNLLASEPVTIAHLLWITVYLLW